MKTTKKGAKKAPAATPVATQQQTAVASVAPATADQYVIFQTGGKQYQGIQGKTVAIEKLSGDVGQAVQFEDVLLRKGADGSVQIGQPFLKAPVKASIVKHMRGPKVIVFKFKRRKKSRVKKGHRQEMTIVRIESV